MALSRHLPSPLVGPVTLIPGMPVTTWFPLFPLDYLHSVLYHVTSGCKGPILIVEVSPSSVTISPNDPFTATCTARAEVDGQGVHVLTLMSWACITKSPSGLMRASQVSQLRPTEYDITTTGSPGSGY